MGVPPEGVTVAEFAEMIKKTPARVYQLIEVEKMPHRLRGKGRRGIRIVVEEAWDWLYARAAAKDAAPKQGAEKPDPEAEERALKRRVERRLLELQLATEEGQLLDRSEVEEFDRAQEGAFVAFITGQLQRFEPEIVTAATPVDARRLTERIKREILTARREYGDQLEREAADIELAEAASAEVPEPSAA